MITRTKEQRQTEIKIIIKKLNELHLNTSYNGIKLLFKSLNDYKDATEAINIDIPCPELNIAIKGILEVDLKKKVWVKLVSLDNGNVNKEE
jgi:hypothetical protein